MSTEQQSAGNNTNAPAAPAAAGNAAQGNAGQDPLADLDAALSEYDGSSAGQQTATPPAGQTNNPPASQTGNNEVSTLLNEVRGLVAEGKAQREETLRASIQKDMGVAIKSVRGDLSAEAFDDDFVEAWLDAQARKDTRLGQAFAQRERNPRQYNKVIEALGKTFHSKYSKMPDANATADREAVAHAVRGSSNPAPQGQAPNYGGLTNREFAAQVKKDFGFDPGVG